MNVIPFSNYINVSALNDDFNYNKTYKKWSTISPPSLPVRTKYMIGGFEPNTQIAVNINGSFWNAYTSNSSGYISFIYDEDGGSRYPSLKRFEANADNKAALVSILLLAVIAMVLIALFVVVRRHKREKKIAEITSAEKWSKTENKIPPK
jgi:hypothetical protein